MEHQQVRSQILKTLYQKYYAGQWGHFTPTDEVIQESFIHTDNPCEFYPDVAYLEEKGYICGVNVSGQTQPIHIQITIQGIDIVEKFDNLLQQLHYERRFRILKTLYQKYFGGEFGREFATDEIIKKSGLGEIDQNEIYPEVIYLKEKYLIDGILALGPRPIIAIKISTNGIDAVENIVNQSLMAIRNLITDPNTKNEIEKIQNENNLKIKMKEGLEFIIKHPDWIETTAKIVKSIITGQMDF